MKTAQPRHFRALRVGNAPRDMPVIPERWEGWSNLLCRLSETGHMMSLDEPDARKLRLDLPEFVPPR